MKPVTTYYQVPVAEIYYDPTFNCRVGISPQSVMELADSIAKNGLQQAILIQPYTKGPEGTKYRIVMGHRRYTACRQLKMDTIVACVSEEMDDYTAKMLNYTENIDRKKLSLLEEAQTLLSIFPPGTSPAKMAQSLSRSHNWCIRRLAIMDYPSDVQRGFHLGLLGVRDIIALNTMPKQDRVEAAQNLMQARANIAEKRRGQIRMGSVRQKKAPRTTDDIRRMVKYLDGKGLSGFTTRVLWWVLGELCSNDIHAQARALAREKHDA